MERKICIRKTRLRKPHFLKSSSSEHFLQADWRSLAASSILHLTETISLASVQLSPTAAVWRPRVSNYLLPRLSSTSDSQPRVKFLCKRQLNGRSREEGQHAHVAHDAFQHSQAGHLCATHRLCHGVRKILSQALKSKIQN